MRKSTISIVLISVLLLLTACGRNFIENIAPVETPDSSETTTTSQTIIDLSESTTENFGESVVSKPSKIETLDDAVKWYLDEKESHKYLEGQHFVASYRILDTQESSKSITIYTHILCEWINLNGESVSGGAGLASVTFKKNDNVYEYEKATSYGAQQIPGATEIPQKVKDAVSTDSYFEEMRAEVDKDIADFLESSR